MIEVCVCVYAHNVEKKVVITEVFLMGLKHRIQQCKTKNSFSCALDSRLHYHVTKR